MTIRVDLYNMKIGASSVCSCNKMECRASCFAPRVVEHRALDRSDRLYRPLLPFPSLVDSTLPDPLAARQLHVRPSFLPAKWWSHTDELLFNMTLAKIAVNLPLAPRISACCSSSCPSHPFPGSTSRLRYNLLAD